jgi:phage-related protein
VKTITWLGSSYKDLLKFPELARQAAGYQLYNVQLGLEPSDWKPMTSVGLGVKEIRLHHENEYRVLYIAKFKETIYVLHAFVKKSPETLQADIALAKQRYQKILQERGK